MTKTPKSSPFRYEVLRDCNEQTGHGWVFADGPLCAGTFRSNLETGDYTLRGYEKRFAIERKGSVIEFVQNITVKDKWRNFKDELERLQYFEAPFIVLEFTMADLLTYPQWARLPLAVKRRVKVRPAFLLQRLLEIQLAFKTRILFAGTHGKEIASSLFKRIIEKWSPAGSKEKPSV